MTLTSTACSVLPNTDLHMQFMCKSFVEVWHTVSYAPHGANLYRLFAKASTSLKQAGPIPFRPCLAHMLDSHIRSCLEMQ